MQLHVVTWSLSSTFSLCTREQVGGAWFRLPRIVEIGITTTMEQPLDGRLHLYSLEPRLVAFESGPPTSDAVVFVGGLNDGLAALPVLPQLHEGLAQARWSLVQPILSSSYKQWGQNSIDSDAAEINRLCEYLANKGKKRIVLLGHSTGVFAALAAPLVSYLFCQSSKLLTSNDRLPGESPKAVALCSPKVTRQPSVSLLTVQDIVNFFRTRQSSVSRGLVVMAILQAPVSDREYLTSQMPPDLFGRSIAHASALIAAGQGEELMPLDLTTGFPGVVIEARRWHSLAAKGGYEDFFSSDLPPQELRSLFSCFDCNIRVHFLLGEEDRSVPDDVDKHLLAQKFATALPDHEGVSGVVSVIPFADHQLSDPTSREKFVEIVLDDLRGLDREGE
jgi:Protein of unknown function (DUF1749)